jgi:hypothetical protein
MEIYGFASALYYTNYYGVPRSSPPASNPKQQQRDMATWRIAMPRSRLDTL